jgi:hypothetical protein
MRRSFLVIPFAVLVFLPAVWQHDRWGWGAPFIHAAGGLLLLGIVANEIVLFRRRRAQRLRLRRARTGCCLTCGYRLTGNVSGICPECGTPFEIYARIGPSYVTREIRQVDNPQNPT